MSGVRRQAAIADLPALQMSQPPHLNRWVFAAAAGAPYDVVLSGARIDGTLDADGDFKLERLMAAARPLGNRAAPTDSLSAPATASGALRPLTTQNPISTAGFFCSLPAHA